MSVHLDFDGMRDPSSTLWGGSARVRIVRVLARVGDRLHAAAEVVEARCAKMLYAECCRQGHCKDCMGAQPTNLYKEEWSKWCCNCNVYVLCAPPRAAVEQARDAAIRAISSSLRGREGRVQCDRCRRSLRRPEIGQVQCVCGRVLPC